MDVVGGYMADSHAWAASPASHTESRRVDNSPWESRRASSHPLALGASSYDGLGHLAGPAEAHGRNDRDGRDTAQSNPHDRRRAGRPG
jgi:hypothetical protein